MGVHPFGKTWSHQGSKLTAKGGEETGSGKFGESVGLSADGNTALVGAPEDNGNVGAAYVFTRSGGTWSQQGSKLTGGEESGKASFGYSVALSANAATAMIGGPDDEAPRKGRRGCSPAVARPGASREQS